jgi:hypothetical protein
VRIVTFAARALLVLLVAGLLDAGLSAATPSASTSPQYTFRDVALVRVIGHGSVQSTPHGIHCPGACRAVFVRGTHLSLRAHAAPGWRFLHFASLWCPGHPLACAFDLVSPHDCVGGACPLGVFGVHAIFVRAKPA